MNRLLKTYVDNDKELSALDKRLLKGFYVADKTELCNSSEAESQRYMNNANFGQSTNLLQGVSIEQAQNVQTLYDRWKAQKERNEAKPKTLQISKSDYTDSGIIEEDYSETIN